MSLAAAKGVTKKVVGKADQSRCEELNDPCHQIDRFFVHKMFSGFILEIEVRILHNPSCLIFDSFYPKIEIFLSSRFNNENLQK